MYIIFLFITLLAAYLFLSRQYQKKWDKNLELSLKFANSGVFEGEQSELVERLTNKKSLPVFWGTIQFKTSCRLRFGETDPDTDYYRRDTISVFAYEDVAKRHTFTASRRGFYQIKEAQLTAIDLFYTAKLLRSFPVSSEIYVYPRVKDTGRFEIDFTKVMGDVIARRNTIEDPFFFRGIRDYCPSDSIKAVNWSATARTGGLKVNQFHTTCSQEVKLLLDFDSYNKLDGQEIKEDLIRIAAMLAQRLIQSGIPTGLVTNAADTANGGRIENRCKGGSEHYISLLKSMAKIDTENLLTPFDRVLTSLPGSGGTQYILISYYAGPELAERYARLQASGYSLQWILLKDKSRNIFVEKHRGVYICEVDY